MTRRFRALAALALRTPSARSASTAAPALGARPAPTRRLGAPAEPRSDPAPGASADPPPEAPDSPPAPPAKTTPVKPPWIAARDELRAKHGADASWQPRRKLTRAQADRLRALAASGKYNKQQLVRVFGVSYPSVCRIVRSRADYSLEELDKKAARESKSEKAAGGKQAYSGSGRRGTGKATPTGDWRTRDLGL